MKMKEMNNVNCSRLHQPSLSFFMKKKERSPAVNSIGPNQPHLQEEPRVAAALVRVRCLRNAAVDSASRAACSLATGRSCKNCEFDKKATMKINQNADEKIDQK